MRPQYLFCIAALSSLLFSGCAGTGHETRQRGDADTSKATGFETKPADPAVEEVRASSEGATATPAGDSNRFLITFPAGNGYPAAVFAFKKTNINDRLGLALDVRNLGPEPVRIYADLNGNTWSRGYLAVARGSTGTLYMLAMRKKFAASDTAKCSGMNGIPGGKMSLWAGMKEPIVADHIKVFMVTPKHEARVQIGNIRPFGCSLFPSLAAFYPFIDRYGQYKHKEWPGKVHGDGDLQANLQKEEKDLAQHSGPRDLDKYGGWAAGPRLEATGHFRTAKYRDQWWLVDPEGRLFWSEGIDCVKLGVATRLEGREQYFEEPPADGNYLARNLQTKYGAQWQTAATEHIFRRLHSWGINTLGAWSDEGFTKQHKMPYTIVLHSGVKQHPELSIEALAENVGREMTQVRASIADDPWCLGFFVDNEIHSNDPGWFEAYYRAVSALAKEILPNKLYLGSRLPYHNWPKESEARRQIVRSAAKYCDVISFNFYKYTVEDFVLPAGVDRPVLISEFHMGALDRGLFHTGIRSVADQNQRAEAYRYYVTTALQNPVIVGTHWFQLYDQPTTGRYDGENYQIGFLDGCDTPYWETIAAAREVSYDLYPLRLRGGRP
jgi:hypothetical protein